MNSQKLIDVFYDTLTLSKELNHNNHNNHNQSVRYSGLLENYIPNAVYPTTTISIVNRDCLIEATNLATITIKITIKIGVNMASDICAGGGVKKGSRAQEEEICRRTSLYPCLQHQSYPLYPLEIIYSPEIAILKTPDYSPIERKIYIDVLSMAAIRRPLLTKTGEYRSSDRTLMKNKVRLLLQTAHYHGLDTLVLGAWGCGAFCNPANEVATIFRSFLDGEFKGAFRHISFAILESSQHLGNAFRSVFNS